MKLIEISDLKKIQLSILHEVASFCETNGIRYFLSYGTLLGAVRHRGYIPWDDDIDIMMPRIDYMKFIQSFNEYHQKNKVISHYLDSKYPWPFAKVVDTTTTMEEHINYAYVNMGVYIDVFPIDGLPYKKNQIVKIFRKAKILKLIISIKRGKKNHSRPALQNFILNFSFLFSFIDYAKLLKKFDEVVSQYSFDEAKYTAILVEVGDGITECIPRIFYDQKVSLLFENGSFNAPVEYEKWLECIYGDYMTLPPVEKRITHHVNNAYYKEE